MTARGHLYGAAALLTVLGLGVFVYKTVFLGFPLSPGQESAVWTVQPRVSFEALGGPVKVTLQIPGDPPGFTLLDESFISRGYGVTTSSGDGGRQARWTKRYARGPQHLYYRVLVHASPSALVRRRRPETPPPPRLSEPHQTALRTVVEEVRERSADAPSFAAQILQRLNAPSPSEPLQLFLEKADSATDRARIAVTLLAGGGIPARVAHGLILQDQQRRATLHPWLEVYTGEEWIYLDPASGERRLRGDFLLWWRGDRPLLTLSGAEKGEVQISVQRSQIDALTVAERRAELRDSRVVEFSLLSLPIQVQAVYGVLLLVPLGAFIMAVLRNVVGVRTIGTFMPVLVALAFRETRLVSGVLLFALVVALGLLIRFYLEQLRLLLVPRLASVLIVVVLLMAAISVFSHRLGLETGLSVALFPMVIMAMAIEHMSIVWEERGAGEALKQGAGTLLVAALAYLVMSASLLQHLVFLFPELLLVVLAATLLLGRYSGYRLLELSRFRVFRRGGA